MKKSLKRIVLVLVVMMFLGFGFSCKKKPVDPTPDSGNQGTDTTKTTYKITYVLDGGTLPASAKAEYEKGKAFVLPTPTKEGFVFAGWYEDKAMTGTKVSALKNDATGDKTFYAKWDEAVTDAQTKWDLNQIGFDGQGMKILIKVLPVSEYDPFDNNFSGDKKALKQAHLSKVESAYNVDIEYSAWDNEAPWGPDRVKFIKESYLNNQFKQKGVYVVTIASQWIPTLVKGKALAELYDMSNGQGIFASNPEEYEQNETINNSFAVNKKVYGYATGIARPDYFLYYNVDLAARTGLEDPAELWFKGEWTWSKFESWVQTAQTNIGAGNFVMDAGYAEFSIGAVASTGNAMTSASRGQVYIAKSSVTGVFDKMQNLYKGGFWNKGHGTNDVTTQFISGQTIFASGDLWFLKESTRFDPSKINFQIGIVPYPAADDDVLTPITNPYEYEDSQGNTVKVETPLEARNGQALTTSDGEKIYGLDLSDASFQVPFTGTSAYAIMNYDSGQNGITPAIVFAILHDLVSSMNDTTSTIKLTNDEAYRGYLKTKIDGDIDVEVVMSTQNNTYFELMEVLSMTVGDGSHFGPNAFWPLASSIVSGSDTPATKLKEVENVYLDALKSIGY